MTLIRGAFLKGLYAVFSINTPSNTVAIKTTGIAIYQGILDIANIMK